MSIENSWEIPLRDKIMYRWAPIVFCLCFLLCAIPGAAQPANDNFPGETLVGDSGSIQGTTIDATREAGEPYHDGTSTPSVWYTWTAPATGGVEFSTCQAASFVTVLAIYSGSGLGSLTTLGSSSYDCGSGSRLAIPVTAGSTYHIVIALADYNSSSGTSALSPVSCLYRQIVNCEGEVNHGVSDLGAG